MAVKYQDPNFDSKKYWRNRKAGIRGQATDAEYKAVMAIKKHEQKNKVEK